MAEPAARSRRDQGTITPGFDGAGEVFLSRGAHTLRLAWHAPAAPGDPGSNPAARLRPVAAGEWTVRGYRIQRTATDGAAWIVSIASKGYRKITVEAGKTLDLEIRPELKLRASARGPKGRMRVGMSFAGQGGHTGVTLYRNGKRIAVRYRLVDAQGDPVAEGPMAYG